VVEVDEAGWSARDASTSSALSKKDVSRAIRDNFEKVMGLHGQVVSFELHGEHLTCLRSRSSRTLRALLP
jgi:hypothetical protein